MFSKIKTFFELIKFEHTLFALPFAYLGMIAASKGNPGFRVALLVTLAMASARTAGMTLNRLIDKSIDARNPRTKNRSLVTGEFKPVWAWGAAATAILIFLISAALLNPLCLKLSPIALLFLTVYHYAKRFTYFCHGVLGFVLSIAPMGGWIAVTGSMAWEPVCLSLAVLFWVAGFDILYSLQDADFDRAAGLRSVPVTFGIPASLKISSALHALTMVALIVFGFAAGLGTVYAVGLVLCAILLRIEHGMVSEDNLTKINTAFFTINGWIGVLLLIFTWMDLYR